MHVEREEDREEKEKKMDRERKGPAPQIANAERKIRTSSSTGHQEAKKNVFTYFLRLFA